MNVIWVVADTFRKDHVGAYGHPYIKTPVLDSLAARGTRFDRHYIGGFPTMPTRADHATGRWTMSFMGWEPFDDSVTTLAQTLAAADIHTAAVVDTPFYWRHGFNYDRGFQTFWTVQGQEGSGTRVVGLGHHESRDTVAWWRKESDRSVAQTMTKAGDWLERHYKEDFFLYVDTWDPHEPWDAPNYYTELYMPDFDGEYVQPPYAFWQDVPGLSQARVDKAHATYCGEITMVDTWLGYLLRKVQNMGIEDETAIIFTSDHGFYFGEHGGRFGKMTFGKRPNGEMYGHGDPDSQWDFSPLYEEVTAIPLLIHVPGMAPNEVSSITAAIDVMPTVLELFGQDIPGWVEGRSLLSAVKDPKSFTGREYAISTIPFANEGDRVSSVDNISRPLTSGIVTTVTTQDHTLLYSVEAGESELYHLPSDATQLTNVIGADEDVARAHHQLLLRFMKETNLSEALMTPRLDLRL